MQSPAAIIETVTPLVPLVVQTDVVVLLKITGEVDAPPVALTVNAASPKVRLVSAAKVIACAAAVALTDCVACGAAPKLILPDWFAVMEHAPAAVAVTVVPVIEQGPDATA